jgi:hypothetical protein
MKAIVQKIKFKATPKELFELYMDSKKHTLATGGGKAVMSRKVGGSFSAWNGYIRGKNLEILPGKRVVQSWRGTSDFSAKEDSILILEFEKAGGGAVLTMVHVVPDRHVKHLSKGWHDCYWKPWKKFLAQS